MIYVDTMGHMVTDETDPEELHAFAERIGLKRYHSEQRPGWYQFRGRAKDHPHYDLTTARKRREAIAAGAIPIDPRRTIGICLWTQAKRRDAQSAEGETMEAKQTRRKRVYICSPLQGTGSMTKADIRRRIRANLEKAKRICHAVSWHHDVIPIAPHVYFCQFCDDTLHVERQWGRNAGMELLLICDELWICGEEISAGMAAEINAAAATGMPLCRFDIGIEPTRITLTEPAIAGAMRSKISRDYVHPQ